MGRQPRCRRVNFVPRATYFKPAGVRLAQLEEKALSVEEAESIRLKDLEGLEQEECARSMNVSRTTFARVLTSARKKIADALINGKAIKIEGGNYEMTFRRFKCINGHEWNISFEETPNATQILCPVCQTGTIMPTWFPQAQGTSGCPGKERRGRGRRHQF